MHRQYDVATPLPPRVPSAADVLRPALKIALLCPTFASCGRCASDCKMAHGPEELAWLRRRKQAEAAAEAGVPAAVPGAGWGLHHAAGDAASTTSSAGSSAAGFRTDHQTRTVPCRYFRQGYCRKGNYCTFSHEGPPSSYSRSASRFGTPQPPTPPRARWGEPQPGEDAEIASLLDGSYLTRSGGQQQAPAPAADVSASRAGERPAQRYSSGPVVAAAAAAAAASCRPPPVQAPKPPPPPPPRKPEVPYASSAAAGTGDRAVAQGSGSSRGGGSGGRAFTEEDCALLRKHFHSLLCPLTHEPFVDPVVAADGNIYERASIEQWLYKEGKDTSPLTNERLPHKVLVPCATMTRCIEEVWDYICKMRASVL